MKNRMSSRRALLKSAAAFVAAAALAPAVAQQGKPQPGLRVRSKEEVGYRDEPYLGRTCARCVLYQGHGKCVILGELVSPNGWCKQWVPNTMG